MEVQLLRPDAVYRWATVAHYHPRVRMIQYQTVTLVGDIVDANGVGGELGD